MQTLPTGSVSFIMAGFNEEKIVKASVQAVSRALSGAFEDYEIILVDDASTDHTLRLMRECAAGDPHIRIIENTVNLNYGAAVLRGLLSAQKAWAIYDAFDLEMDPQDFVRLFLTTDPQTDVVIYERETYEATFYRRVASLGNKMLLHLLFPCLMRGTPTLNHTQLFRTACIRDILPLSRSPIFFSAELIFRAKLKKLSWCNQKVPFHSINGIRKGSFGHPYDILWAITDMLRFRLKLWTGKIPS